MLTTVVVYVSVRAAPCRYSAATGLPHGCDLPVWRGSGLSHGAGHCRAAAAPPNVARVDSESPGPAAIDEPGTGRAGAGSWLADTNRNPALIAFLRRARRALPGDPAREIFESGCKPMVWEIEKLFSEEFFREKYMLYVPLK